MTTVLDPPSLLEVLYGSFATSPCQNPLIDRYRSLFSIPSVPDVVLQLFSIPHQDQHLAIVCWFLRHYYSGFHCDIPLDRLTVHQDAYLDLLQQRVDMCTDIEATLLDAFAITSRLIGHSTPALLHFCALTRQFLSHFENPTLLETGLRWLSSLVRQVPPVTEFFQLELEFGPQLLSLDLLVNPEYFTVISRFLDFLRSLLNLRAGCLSLDSAPIQIALTVIRWLLNQSEPPQQSPALCELAESSVRYLADTTSFLSMNVKIGGLDKCAAFLELVPVLIPRSYSTRRVTVRILI
jgi:hypothetical protein